MLVAYRASADMCSDVCQEMPGLCGSSGSHCDASQNCADLFWSSDEKISLCNAETEDCPEVLPFKCSEALLYISDEVSISTVLEDDEEELLSWFDDQPDGVGGLSMWDFHYETPVVPQSRGAVPVIHRLMGGPEQRVASSTSIYASLSEWYRSPEPHRGKHVDAASLLASMKGQTTVPAEAGEDWELIDFHNPAKRSKGNSPESDSDELAEKDPQQGKTFDDMSDDDLLAMALAMSQGDDVPFDETPGRLGVTNLGLSCYMSAVLQVLLHSPRFIEFLRKTELTPDHRAFHEMANIATLMWAANPSVYINPINLLNILRESRGGHGFTPFEMEDAHDAMRILLGLIHDSTLDKHSGKSLIDGLFGVHQRTSRKCSGCGHIRHVRAIEHDLILPIPEPKVPGESVTIEECLAANHVPETVNSVECPACTGKHDAEMQYHIDETRDVLVVVLRRFSPTGDKIKTFVQYSPALNLTVCMEIIRYKLLGVVHHQGSTRAGGHYVADYFHHEHTEWVHANDASVQRIDGPVNMNSDTAYVLLYERT